MAERFDSVVVGGGQAGLAVSELTRAGVEHAVLERGRIGRPGAGTGTASA